MDDHAETLNWQRVALVGILLLFVVPVEAGILEALNVPSVAYYVATFTTAGAILAFLAYLRVRLGRDMLLNLFPTWLAKWPHMRVAWLALFALLVWYLIGLVWTPGALVNRVVWGELITVFMVEVLAQRIVSPRGPRHLFG